MSTLEMMFDIYLGIGSGCWEKGTALDVLGEMKSISIDVLKVK